MADESQILRGIDWREAFPFTHLFRAFRIAIHPSKLVLGLLLILTVYLGGRILDGIWPSGSLPKAYDIRTYEAERWAHVPSDQIAQSMRGLSTAQRATFLQRWDSTLAEQVMPDADRKRGIFDEFFAYESQQISDLLDSALGNRWLGNLGSPYQNTVVGALSNLLIIGPGWLLTQHTIYCILFATIFLLAWALFGGAISRIAAVHVARDEKIALRQAIGFSANKILSFVFAPLIPLIIILFAGIVVAIGGCLYYVPWIGPIVAGALFILALVAGFVMTLVGTGMIGGLNLMFPTVAVEGTDSFDAISRSFSYIFARPWRMLFYTAVSLIYGALCYQFVRWFLYVMLCMTHYFVSWWLGGQPGANFPAIWPTPNYQSLVFSPDWEHLKFTEAVSAGFICFWVYLIISLLGAFLISFYFSINTIIYYLMRQEVDATELDDVYIEEPEDEFTETPVAKSPAGPATSAESATAAAVPVSESNAPPASQPPAGTVETATVIVVERPTPPPPEPPAV